MFCRCFINFYGDREGKRLGTKRLNNLLKNGTILTLKYYFLTTSLKILEMLLNPKLPISNYFFFFGSQVTKWRSFQGRSESSCRPPPSWAARTRSWVWPTSSSAASAFSWELYSSSCTSNTENREKKNCLFVYVVVYFVVRSSHHIRKIVKIIVYLLKLLFILLFLVYIR